MKTALIALGGNALLRPDEKGTIQEQYDNMRTTCGILAGMIEEGYELVLTHGNGPQVGNILMQNELGSQIVPPMPLDVCVSQSQGQIGYIFQQALLNELTKRGLRREICSLITQVLVDKNDPAFSNPTKFVGPYYLPSEAERLKKEKGWDIKEAEEGKFRRVVPSPKPKRIIESHIIKELVFSGDDDHIIIAAGGGGIPVVEENGFYKGIDGVIDKDLASAVLAVNIKEKLFIMLTRVDKVCINFSEPDERPIDSMTVEEAKQYLKEGHFPPGSMGPKIKASIYFLENGGERVLITSSERLASALEGKDGTYIQDR
ncbi:MAG: carbamate kinase [Thermoplasmata archaeon]